MGFINSMQTISGLRNRTRLEDCCADKTPLGIPNYPQKRRSHMTAEDKYKDEVEYNPTWGFILSQLGKGRYTGKRTTFFGKLKEQLDIKRRRNS